MFSEVTVPEQHSVNKMGTGWHKPMSLQHQCDPNQVCTGNVNIGKCMILLLLFLCHHDDSNNK